MVLRGCLGEDHGTKVLEEREWGIRDPIGGFWSR